MSEQKACHDCGTILSAGDEYMPYEANGWELVKCRSCHEKDPVCRGFQPTECYSRVVGYIRPISQMNSGKRAEYEDRKVYKLK